MIKRNNDVEKLSKLRGDAFNKKFEEIVDSIIKEEWSQKPLIASTNKKLVTNKPRIGGH